MNDPIPIGTSFLYLSDSRSARQVHNCNQIIWDRIAFALHLGVFGAGLIQVALAVQKNLEMAIIIILNNPY